MRLLLDAGHGIDTPGKRSPDGAFREYLWNRQVCDLIEGLVARCIPSLEVEQVVTETNDIPLKTRAMRVNKVCDQLGSDNVLLVSIHSNAAGDGSAWMNARGWSAYTTKGQTQADKLADSLYAAFTAEFTDQKIRRDSSDGDDDWEEDFYILKKTRCPAVLLENFFYDNAEECRWLLTDDAKERIARATVNGILFHLSRTDI